MSNEKYTLGYAKIIIAKFMGLDSVQVGYADSEEETEWQRNHEEWMKEVGLTQVGRYFVNVKENKWHEWDDVKYDSSWDWLMPVVEKICSLLKDHHLTIEVMSSYNVCYFWSLESGQREIANKSEVKLIDTVYAAVYQFIIWFNQQKQKDEHSN